MGDMTAHRHLSPAETDQRATRLLARLRAQGVRVSRVTIEPDGRIDIQIADEADGSPFDHVDMRRG